VDLEVVDTDPVELELVNELDDDEDEKTTSTTMTTMTMTTKKTTMTSSTNTTRRTKTKRMMTMKTSGAGDSLPAADRFFSAGCGWPPADPCSQLNTPRPHFHQSVP